ncbi:MAG: MBL fold metallo-hydrolase [Ilumatobacteraceae bacterium]
MRDASRAVLVDCGMFQGLRELRRRNWTAPPFDVEAIDAVILSHAHLDHCGYLPRLIRDGFHGRVIATEATAELAGIVLPDSGHLQEEEAEYANRRGTSRHDPAEPLYTEAEGRRAAAAIETVRFGDDVELAPGLVARLSRAGHILGSSIVALDLDGERRIGFSGDLGRPSHPLLVSPDPVPDAEVLLVESTYGNRRHADTAALDAFADAIERTIARGGSVLIPAFAVDRTEVILFHLARLADAGRLPSGVPVYVDSPMALSAMRVYRHAIERRDPDVQIDGGHDPFRVPIWWRCTTSRRRSR